MHTLSNMNMLSPDGHSYSFDHRANGYSRGEGAGILILKRVADAIRDNDTIRGIIRSTGSNQDGHTSSIAVPSSEMQTALIRDTYRKAGLSMVPTRFFEAHGTGTPVGDPLESKAIGRAFRDTRAVDDPLWVGALKTNIGHLEGASGVASVIKAMLVLEKAVIPANTNFERLNPKIDAEYLRLAFPRDNLAWPVRGLRRASVNSFGNAGTNAHVVLDDVHHFLAERGLSAHHLTVRDPPSQLVLQPTTVPLPIVSSPGPDRPRLLILSAHDEKGVQRQAQAYAAHFAQAAKHLDPQYLDHLAYTLAFRRSTFEWTSFAVVRSVDELSKLDQLVSAPMKRTANPSAGFLFAGQGAQWAGMGRELMLYPAFADSLHRSEKLLHTLGCPWDLREEIHREKESRIDTPELSQPCCTALQIALVDFLRSIDVSPAAVVGHSSGEIAAAYCIGALSAESALKVAYHRGIVCGQLASDPSGPRGAMMAVGLSSSDIQPYLTSTPGLVVACINSPKNVTISGDAPQIDALQAVLDEKHIFARKLVVRVAYHSHHMQRVSETYRQAITGLKPGLSPAHPIAMVSSVTGTRIALPTLLTPDYWVQNLTSPVDFLSAMTTLLHTSAQRIRRKLDLSHRDHFTLNALVELSPHAVLQRPVQETLRSTPPPPPGPIPYTSLLHRTPSTTTTTATTTAASSTSTLTALGTLKTLGHPFPLSPLNHLTPTPTPPPTLLSLPTLPSYKFNHSQTYWQESRLSKSYRLQGRPKHDLLGKPAADWNPHEPRWRLFLRSAEMPWVEDHVVNGVGIYPGAGMVEMVVEGAREVNGDRDGVNVLGFEVRDVVFSQPIKISPEVDGVEVQLVIHVRQQGQKGRRALEDGSTFRIFAHEGDAWVECCFGVVRAVYARDTAAEGVDGGRGETARMETYRATASDMDLSCTTQMDVSRFYTNIGARGGVEFGPCFRRMRSGVLDAQGRVRATISTFPWPEDQFPQPHVIHPVTLDAAFHSAYACFSRGGETVTQTRIPTFLRRLYVRATGMAFPRTEVFDAYLHALAEDRRRCEVSGFVMDEGRAEVMLEYEDLRMTTVAAEEEEEEGEGEGQGTVGEGDKQLTYHVEYRPEPELMTADEIRGYCEGALHRYLDMLAHKNGGMRVLEVDMGCLGLTREVLRTLSVSDHAGAVLAPRYASFTFAVGDEDVGELGFQGFPDVGTVRLGLMEDWQAQGLQSEGYDLVFAQGAVSEAGLRRLRALLAPGGRLVMPLSGGLVDEAAFAATGMVYPGLELHAEEMAVSVHGLVETVTAPETDREVFFVLDPQSAVQTQVFEALRAHWRARGIPNIRCGTLEEAADIADKDGVVFVPLLEIDQPFTYNLNAGKFESLRTFFDTASDVLWPTFAGGSEAGPPEYQLIHGLTRALRSEYPQMSVTVVSLDATETLSERQMNRLARLLLDRHVDPKPWLIDVEFLEQDDMLHIPRVVPAGHVTHELAIRSTDKHTSVKPMADCPPLELTGKSLGMLDSFGFVEDAVALTDLAADEVEIQTHAIGVTFRDYQVAMGQIADAALGQECAGIVTRAGPQTSFSPGDRVMLAAPNGFKTLARGKLAVQIPDSMPFTTAASIPIDFGTAWTALHRLAQLQVGETILIHAAASSPGQAAIQLAQRLGATIFATVSTAPKKQLLMDEYHIPESHIFYSRDASFVHGIQRATHSRGVDVILNTLRGPALQSSWSCIAPYGRLIDLSQGPANLTLPANSHSLKHATITTLDITHWLQHRPTLAQQDLQTLLTLFTTHNLRPTVPQTTHPMTPTATEALFRAIHTRAHIGKSILTLPRTLTIPVTLTTRPTYTFPSNATYLIAGGLGGLGRVAARWLVSRGARHLILLSRFGPRTPAAHALISELTGQGIHLATPPCDITSLPTLRGTLATLSETFPPIAGAFQMSIIARDTLWPQLTHESWTAAVAVRTTGSYNLHLTLPDNLTFFILLSSASGLAGFKGQTNYDAGNTYEDALARYRVSQGQAAVAVDLGALVDDGILTEDPRLLRRVLAYGALEPITRRRFLAVLDWFCDPERMEAQLAVGLGTGENRDANRGLERVTYSSLLQQVVLAGERKERERVRKMGGAGGGAGGATGPIDTRARNRGGIASAESLDEAAGVVGNAVIAMLARSLVAMQDAHSVDWDRQLQMYGVDSLLATELRNWIVKEFLAEVAVFETQGASTLRSLSLLVAGRTAIEHRY
ncbi:putative polyketide synthase [Aspergillus heteromorphus CBS 117.55]|uniref:Putative polyketide synthase n=1 Tax=Aspergillus heteromorphus CBS 117.55 TaxID=1448321 RepID=A0A317W830_9EURO|nr:putative polyketide synthase [Aspergillus heteromorphus CBS 117.55]PWY82065.1 putative polyketide synthase [Aspergillus heteromorphus CBS 117.55]